MFVFLRAAHAVLGILALASSSATQAQGSVSISIRMPSLTSAENKTRNCTESQCPVERKTTTPDNLNTSMRHSSTLRGAEPTSPSEVDLIYREVGSILEYWQLAPSFIPNDLEIGYTAIDEDGTDVTRTRQDPLISGRAPSSASSTSTETSIDSVSLFLGPLISTDTTSTSSSLTSTSSSSVSKSTATVHTTSTKFTTVVATTLRVTASASTSSLSSSTNNPFTAITSTTTSSSQITIETLPLQPTTSSSSQDTVTLPLPPSTSSSSSLSSVNLPTSLSTAIPTSSSALTQNVISSSAQAGTSNPTTSSPVSPTTFPPLTNATPASSSTMAPINMLSTSSTIGIGAGVGASGLLIISFLAAWFIIRRRRKRHAEEREKQQSVTNMVMDTDPTRYEKPDVVPSQPSSTSAQDAAELGASGVYEMDAGSNVWPGDGHGRTSPRLYRPIQGYGREDGRGRSYVG